MNPKDYIKQEFAQIFGEQPQRLFMSPGRVNLIGEHTDYNGGYVFPCALDFGTYGAARKRNDKLVNLVSGNFDLKCQINIGSIKYQAEHGWANYPKGVINEIQKLGNKLDSGFDLFIWGDMPGSAGLSSSASIELLTAVVVNGLFDLKISVKEMALLCQRAENKFIGVNCGIMDQYAAAFGKKDNALLLDCQNIKHEYVPLKLSDCVIMIANTNNKRSLAATKYNERRSECDAALALLKKTVGAEYLCAIGTDEFEANKHLIKDPVILKRATHAVYENARTKEAVEVLGKGDIAAFGKMMNDSHVSLRDLYEVTGPELDALAESAWQTEGVLGSRMTGAGFGGCTVSIVKADAVDTFISKVGEEYKKRTGFEASFYKAGIGAGAREI